MCRDSKNLARAGLTVNHSKTEAITCVSEKLRPHSLKCLGSYIDTDEDITNRINWAAIAKLRQVRKHPDTPTVKTIRKSLLEPLFLYNSELWSLTKAREKVDIMQRKFIRILHSVRLVDRVKNEEVYKRLNTGPWSSVIQKRRLRFFGHIPRLPSETPLEDVSSKHQLDGANRKEEPDWRGRSSLRLIWNRTISTQMTRQHGSRWRKKNCELPVWLNKQCPVN